MGFEDIVSGVEVEGASAPSASTIYDVEVHVADGADPVNIYGELTFDGETDDLVIYGEDGMYTSFNWRYVEYYVARPRR
ncbi:hypothetical protein [Mycobacteroides chelonae]|uniref:hypothetical protein n=1 Tax=Mycobacteroides chelonae TaxID=1774 RepID=UPI000991DDBB|nr:hypothetical protein [Mycobacteroides chelonae]